MTVILICGDRNWNNFEIIEKFIKKLLKGTIIIHGDCRGADKIAGYLAKKYGFEVIAFPADWDKYGKAAGPIRNRQMLIEGKPNLVVAFHNDIEKSRGTANMVTQAKEMNVPVIILTEKEKDI